jgi:hypothetical protein
MNIFHTAAAPLAKPVQWQAFGAASHFGIALHSGPKRICAASSPPWERIGEDQSDRAAEILDKVLAARRTGALSAEYLTKPTRLQRAV